jgi:hypothetical protein
VNFCLDQNFSYKGKGTVARKGHVFSVQIYRFSVEMQFLRANPNVLRTKSLALCKPERSPYKCEASPYKYEASSIQQDTMTSVHQDTTVFLGVQMYYSIFLNGLVV